MSADQQVHLRMSRGVTNRLFCADRTGGENQRHNVVAAHLVAAIASFERHLNMTGVMVTLELRALHPMVPPITIGR